MAFADFQKKLRAEIMPCGDKLAHLAQQRLKAGEAAAVASRCTGQWWLDRS